MENRKRSVNVENLSSESLEEISVKIGEKVKNIVDKAIAEANEILNIYGMEAKMEIAITEKEKVKEE